MDKNSYKDVVEKISRLTEEYQEQQLVITRLCKMYPPDGGGRATDARTKQYFIKQELEKLRIEEPGFNE